MKSKRLAYRDYFKQTATYFIMVNMDILHCNHVQIKKSIILG